MNLVTIKKLYEILTTSDNISEIRANLHKNCDNLNFDVVMNDYITSNDVLLMIKYIKNEYDKMIESEKTVYKITDEELNNRISKLKKVAELFETENNELIRFDKMSKLFKNPNIMHKSYILLIRYGKDDPKLDEIRPLLKNFNTYYREFRDNFKNDVRNKVLNAYQDEADYEKLQYSIFIVKEYIKSNIFIDKDFCKYYSINEDCLMECSKIVKQEDISLYYDFMLKMHENELLFNRYYSTIIEDLNYGINNNQFVYENPFDLLEFIKLIPFKENDNFIEAIDDFMALHNNNCRDNIMKYIKNNKLDDKDAFKVYDYEELCNSKVIINNVTLDVKDMQIITTYFIKRDIPLYKCAIQAACKCYINNNYSCNLLKEDANIKSLKKPVIIPTNNH